MSQLGVIAPRHPDGASCMHVLELTNHATPHLSQSVVRGLLLLLVLPRSDVGYTFQLVHIRTSALLYILLLPCYHLMI